ncbi:phage minor tail protein [Escherichia coli]|nr:phage minor tail protein [Escherichia coli]
MKHTELRAAVLDALEKHDTGATLFGKRQRSTVLTLIYW